jgi:hypothetical protein
MFFVDRSLLASVKISPCLVIRNLPNCCWTEECYGNQTLYTHISGCKVLTAATVRITACRDVAACNAVDIYQKFGGSCCLHLQGLKVDMAGYVRSRHIQEECSLHYKEFLHRSSLFSMLFADLKSCICVLIDWLNKIS